MRLTVIQREACAMRGARFRCDWDLAYYHCVGRVAGGPDYLPFGDVEKEKLFGMVQKLSVLYSCEVLACTVMSNHWHLVLASHPEPPRPDEIKRRWRAFYGDTRAEPYWGDPAVTAHWGKRMRDMSCFVKDLQQGFTWWFNRTRPKGRRWSLWGDRFKSVLLQGETALWECIKYVEMNPVRAGLVSDPAEYRFSSWGRLRQSGRHPFEQGVLKHLRRYLGERAAEWSSTRVLGELSGDMARVCAAERGADPETAARAEKAARKSERFVITVGRRVRYWSDGAIIGSQAFVRETASRLLDPDRAAGKRLTRSMVSDALGELHAFRRLRCVFQ